MTYCAAITVNKGLVFVSDSRTNAGVDSVSTYSKMHTFGSPGERQFVILSAGNLATTQGVISQIKHDINKFEKINLMTVSHLAEAADYIGEISKHQQEKHTGGGVNYEASFIIGGQIIGSKPSIYMIYPQGNHITTSKKTLYLQIGESKYGKPIFDRIIDHNVSLETAALSGLVSMDSTMRSNITVGPPIELTIYHTDSLLLGNHYIYDDDSEYLRELKRAWDENLKDAFNRLP
ncbi:MAG: peptidase, partial [Gammaproteobacteria bacterium]|nr:peptidase [Gammaproteobacteria bacterium]